MPVEPVDPRGEIPGEKLKDAIEALEKKGTVTQIVPLFDEILIVWTPNARPKRETRAAS